MKMHVLCNCKYLHACCGKGQRTGTQKRSLLFRTETRGKRSSEDVAAFGQLETYFFETNVIDWKKSKLRQTVNHTKICASDKLISIYPVVNLNKRSKIFIPDITNNIFYQKLKIPKLYLKTRRNFKSLIVTAIFDFYINAPFFKNSTGYISFKILY